MRGPSTYARDKRGIWEIPDDDKDYLKILSDLHVKLSVPAAPAMPLYCRALAGPVPPTPGTRTLPRSSSP